MPVAFKDYYATLGLPRSASDSEIKTAFRKKAREVHPDTHPDDPSAEEKFKEVNEAYEVLSDAGKRRMYDRFGEDWQRYRDAGIDPDDPGFGRAQTGGSRRYTTTSDDDFEQWFTGSNAPGGSWEWSESGGFREGNGRFSDFFNLLFGNEERSAGSSRPGGRANRPQRGDDLEVQAEISLQEAFSGTARKLTLQTPAICPTCHGNGMVRNQMCPTCDGTGQVTRSRTLEVRIPAGVRTGSRVRIAGQGGAGVNGGPSGDVYLVITVQDDPRFTPEGRDLKSTLNVPLYTAVLGGEVVVPTMSGRVALRIPEGTQSGKVFRLRGKGFPASGKQPAGDLLVKTEIRIPDHLTDAEKTEFEKLRDMRQ